MTKVEIERAKTRNDLESKLNKYGKCALIRPTGFGKTFMLTNIMKGYKKVLFLFPNKTNGEVIVENYGGSTDNIVFITYSLLVRMKKEDYNQYADADLIVLDELHRVGAKGTNEALSKLLKVVKNAKLIGATATPDRMDGFDVIGDFFDDIVVYPYTLHDAFKDKVIKRPYYCYCSFDAEEDIKKGSLDIGERLEKGVIKSTALEISNIFNMPNVIRDTCIKYTDTDYMRFIVFFNSFEHLHNKQTEVEAWFQSAFSDHFTESLIISSETKEYRNNVNKIENLERIEGKIDLILSVDMMNMGYHVKDLTGIVMMRCTESGIIYIQQLGRALSTGSENASVVFDVADNIHRKSVYSMLGERYQPFVHKKAMKLVANCSEEEIEEMFENLTPEEIVKLYGNEDIREHKWWEKCNAMYQEDLIATGKEATYRELIAKTVMEPRLMRARQATARWIEEGGDLNPPTKEHILEQDDPPIDPFLRSKNVGIKDMLDANNIVN